MVEMGSWGILVGGFPVQPAASGLQSHASPQTDQGDAHHAAGAVARIEHIAAQKLASKKTQQCPHHKADGISKTLCEQVFHGEGSAVAALHEHQFFKQGDVLFVFQQCADQGRYGHFVVLGLQRGQRDVFSHQEFQPIQQFGSGGFFL